LDKPSAVIQIGMAENERIQMPHPQAGQSWQKDPTADVGTPPTSTVEENGGFAMSQEDRLPLAHIQQNQLR
jgi:hypothetical protein